MFFQTTRAFRLLASSLTPIVGTPPGAGSLLQEKPHSPVILGLFKRALFYFLQATNSCAITYGYARIRRLVRLGAGR